MSMTSLDSHIERVDKDEARDASDEGAIYLRTGVGIVISIVRSLFLARLLVPGDMSAYRLGISWIGYFGFLSFGSIDTFYFRTPSLLQMGKGAEVQSLRGIALSMSLVTALATGVGTAALIVALGLTNVGTAFLFGLFALLTSLTPYLTIGFWATRQFSRQARIELIVTITGTILALGGLLFWGLPGLLVGSCLSQMLLLWLARELLVFQDIGRANRRDYRQSFSFGLGQSAYVFMQGVLVTIDLQVLALLIGGRDELGVYAFATMLTVAIRTAATAGAVVNQTGLLARQGHREWGTSKSLCQEAECHRRLDNALVSLMSLAALAVVVSVAPIAFPAYAGVVEPLVGLTLSTITLRWGFFHAVTLSMHALQWKAAPLVILGIVVNAVWAYLAVTIGWSMLLVSLAPALGAALYSVATVIFCERMLAQRWSRKTIGHMALTLLAQLPILMVSVTNTWYVNLFWVLLAVSVYVATLFVIDRVSLQAAVGLVWSIFSRQPLVRRLLARTPSLARQG